MYPNTRAQQRVNSLRFIYLWKKANLTDMKQDIAGFSRSFTAEFSATTPINTCGPLSRKSAWKYPRCMSLPSTHQPDIVNPVVTVQYDTYDCQGGREELTGRQDVSTMTKTGRTSRVFRRPTRRNDNYVNTMVCNGGNKKKLYSFVKNKKCEIFGAALP